MVCWRRNRRGDPIRKSRKKVTLDPYGSLLLRCTLPLQYGNGDLHLLIITDTTMYLLRESFAVADVLGPQHPVEYIVAQKQEVVDIRGLAYTASNPCEVTVETWSEDEPNSPVPDGAQRCALILRSKVCVSALGVKLNDLWRHSFGVELPWTDPTRPGSRALE